jgi:molybdate transport system ATP-binding protein
MTTLDAHVVTRLGALHLDVELRADAGETVALLGPNGAGKTTVLRALSGLVPIDAGRIELDGQLLDDGDATFVPPERRPVGVVFQDYVLFPHLSACDNVAFGLRARGVGRTAARRAAATWLETVGLRDHLDRRPAGLSGGEAQRVALARALAVGPRLLVLDEPLAALDQHARVAVRRDLRGRLRQFAGVRVLVTHDPVDAATLADRLVIVEHGRVVQTGTPAEVTAHPRSPWIAELVGVNLLTGTGYGDRVVLDGGGELVAAGAGTGAVVAVVHPHSVTVHAVAPRGSARNVWSGPVESIEPLGDRVRVRIGGAVPLTAEVTPASVAELGLRPGAPVWASVKATDVAVSAA